MKVRNKSNTVGGRVGLTLFGLVFGSFGLFMALMAGREGLADRATLRWQPTPCTVEESRVVDEGAGYRFQITYRYAHGTASFTGTRQNLKGNPTFQDVATGQRLLQTYAAGKPATCYVNPAAPAESVLQRKESLLAFIGPILFCSIFVFIGYGLAIGAWVSGWRAKNESVTGGPRTPVSAQAKGQWGLVLFGAIFLLAGLGITYGTFILPLQRILAARNWAPVEAVVTKSAVREHRGDDSTTYSVYIAYRYTFHDRTYQGDRYRFASGSSSGHAAKQRIVAAHPAGRAITVYVDPASPEESVIQRDAGGALYLGLLPLLFALVGAVILFFGIRAARCPPGTVTQHARAAPGGGGKPARAFKRSSGHAGRILGMLFFALFWNGIVSVFLWQCVQEWQQGRKPIFLSIFLVPFVLVGTGVIVAFFYQVLRAFNPTIILDCPAQPLFPGSTAQLRFHGRGNLQRLSRLMITLQGTEHATYQRGTKSVTDTYVFHTEKLLDVNNPMQMAQGWVRLVLPPDAMHSFQSTHNRIVWSITIAGTIPHWPDLKETYDLNVLPREGGA